MKYYSKILDFWFRDKVKLNWFVKDLEFDQKITTEFLGIYQNQLMNIGRDLKKIEDVKELLSLIILFDQFPRNMFRGKKESFDTDKEALRISRYVISNAFDDEVINNDYLLFLYMPFMHSENLKDQEISVGLFKNVNKQSYEFAIKHKDIIERFGRFPQRNKALGRESTREENRFLKEFTLF